MQCLLSVDRTLLLHAPLFIDFSKLEQCSRSLALALNQGLRNADDFLEELTGR